MSYDRSEREYRLELEDRIGELEKKYSKLREEFNKLEEKYFNLREVAEDLVYAHSCSFVSANIDRLEKLVKE